MKEPQSSILVGTIVISLFLLLLAGLVSLPDNTDLCKEVCAPNDVLTCNIELKDVDAVICDSETGPIVKFLR